jgi:tetratricopeptide (TPR) repeat protein
VQSQAAMAARIAIDRRNSRAEEALRLRADGRAAEALEVLSEPGEYAQDVYTLRGDLQQEIGQLHDAVGSYSTVIALDPENLHAHQNLGVCLRRLGRWDAAADAFQKILDRDSYRDAARLGLAECLLHLDKPEQALACFEACWSEAAVAPALFGKAVALQLLRRFDAAEALYLRLLELQPDSDEALSNLIALSMETLDLARVERYADLLASRRPQSVVALQALIVVAFERRFYDQAAEYYGRLLRVVPEEQLLQNEEMLLEKGNDGALEYRLSRKSIERLNQVRPDPLRRTASY